MRLSVTLTLLAGVLSAPVAAFAEAEAPRKIEFARTQSGYVVLRDGQAFPFAGPDWSTGILHRCPHTAAMRFETGQQIMREKFWTLPMRKASWLRFVYQ